MTGEPQKQADAAHYLSNYGSCTLERCRCAQDGVWQGIMCPHWKTLGAMSHDDMIAMARKLYEENHVSR